METYRLFIAIGVTADVKAQLRAAQARLQQDDVPVKWVAPDALHLTLHFLGDTDPVLAAPLGDALRAALADVRPFQLQLAHVGAFPDLRRPTVVWVGVDGEVALLTHVHGVLASTLTALGLPCETRPFRAHLTIGRVRTSASAEQQASLGDAIAAQPPVPPTPWMVERIVLFRSQLRHSGPRYTVLDAVSLGVP